MGIFKRDPLPKDLRGGHKNPPKGKPERGRGRKRSGGWL